MITKRDAVTQALLWLLWLLCVIVLASADRCSESPKTGRIEEMRQ